MRQIAHRARSHVEARRPRERVPANAHGAVLERFLDAVNGGDLQALMDAMAPDIVLDHRRRRVQAGGAATDPRRARRCCASWPASTRPRPTPRSSRSTARPALRLELDGELEAVATFTFEGELVTGAYIVRNPHKLAGLDGKSGCSPAERTDHGPGASRSGPGPCRRWLSGRCSSPARTRRGPRPRPRRGRPSWRPRRTCRARGPCRPRRSAGSRDGRTWRRR